MADDDGRHVRRARRGRTVLSGCTVRGISFETWGEPGSQVRNYYVAFTVPAGTRSVSFDVDLRAATGQDTSWEWSGAHVVAGGQFTPQQGWTCSDLPRVRGDGADWQSPIYFQVAEQGAEARRPARDGHPPGEDVSPARPG